MIGLWGPNRWQAGLSSVGAKRREGLGKIHHRVRREAAGARKAALRLD